MVELLSVISAAAAVGLRLALPLLVVALVYGQKTLLTVPVLSRIPSTLVLGFLIAWALLEMFGSKRLLSQRSLQILQLALSPVCGVVIALAIVKIKSVDPGLTWLMAGIGGLLAFVLQLVQAGWFYRLRGLPSWVVVLEDALSILLVFAAFGAPKEGGLIALVLLWFAIRSAKEWRDRYIRAKRQRRDPPHPPD